MAVTVTGVDEVVANLNRAIAGIEGRTREGMVMAGNIVKEEAQALTPVDNGDLMNSAHTDTTVTGTRIKTRVLYTAKYAAWVHEMPMRLRGQPRANFGRTRGGLSFGGGTGKGNYWDGGENKFLQKAISRNIPEILAAIRKRARIPDGGQP